MNGGIAADASWYRNRSVRRQRGAGTRSAIADIVMNSEQTFTIHEASTIILSPRPIRHDVAVFPAQWNQTRSVKLRA
jgi:hypothetical protein